MCQPVDILRWLSRSRLTVRGLEEEGNSQHRVRVEHNRETLLVHVSDEDGKGWTTLAIDRAAGSGLLRRGGNNCTLRKVRMSNSTQLVPRPGMAPNNSIKLTCLRHAAYFRR
jgi:hypothetical protein